MLGSLPDEALALPNADEIALSRLTDEAATKPTNEAVLEEDGLEVISPMEINERVPVSAEAELLSTQVSRSNQSPAAARASG